MRKMRYCNCTIDNNCIVNPLWRIYALMKYTYICLYVHSLRRSLCILLSLRRRVRSHDPRHHEFCHLSLTSQVRRCVGKCELYAYL